MIPGASFHKQKGCPRATHDDIIYKADVKSGIGLFMRSFIDVRLRRLSSHDDIIYRADVKSGIGLIKRSFTNLRPGNIEELSKVHCTSGFVSLLALQPLLRWS